MVESDVAPAETAHEAEKPGAGRRRAARMSALGVVAVILAVLFSVVSVVSILQILETDESFESNNLNYNECKDAATELRIASDYLTSQSRIYVTSGERAYLDDYLEELLVTDRRGKAVEVLRSRMEHDAQAIGDLEEALEYSDELSGIEMRAMKLAALAYGERSTTR